MDTYASLKARHRAGRATMPQNLSLRVHRALSWLDRAEREDDDPDARFLFLWIAFNAAYATEYDERMHGTEQETYRAFLQKLVQLDRGRRIEAFVWNEFTGSLRVLLANRYVFHDFWQWRSGRLEEAEWQRRFEERNKSALKAVLAKDTVGALGVALSRLYTLRNQLVHGGATWNGSVNREQLRDGVRLLGQLVPVVIGLMLDHPDTLWGDPCYPVVEAAG